MPDTKDNIIDQLSNDIEKEVGNSGEDDLESISSSFTQTLSDALKQFNSSLFDQDGFIKKFSEIDLPDKSDKETIKSVLNDIRNDYISPDAVNQSEIILKRDIKNICDQMPEMHDAVNVVRDSIIECNVSTGEVSRSLVFENHPDDEALESQVREIENKHDLLLMIKNNIVPRALESGELYIQVVPYAKLFAELELLSTHTKTGRGSKSLNEKFYNSIPKNVKNYFHESVSLYNESNLNILMESMNSMTSLDSLNESKIEADNIKLNEKSVNSEMLGNILRNIHVYNGSSVMYSEYGEEGLRELLESEYRKGNIKTGNSHFMESMIDYSKNNSGIYGKIDQDFIDYSNYKDIKGCYIKYLDPLRIVPIRMDRKVIGYYYVTTTMDLYSTPGPSGVIDLSYQHYTKDRNMVERLAQIVINTFDKQVLEKNIHLKEEIADIIMAHKFIEGALNFIYIPEDEVVRIILNEDEEGKGHSMIEPAIFPARLYLMLTLYNMLYILNNNTTRIHYLKSSGLNKDYASQIQRTIRKFQQRRITIDDIYSYSGVLNKIGGMGEMILPSGRNDFKAIETDTIEAVNVPINTEFLEQQRRQAISGTGVPHLLVINALDEVDFAKTLEMANTRFLSTVSSYKIDFNRGITKLYQSILRASTSMEPEVIASFRFQFNAVKQQELSINADMIQNFNTMTELVQSLYYSKEDMEDQDGKPTAKQMHLRKELAKEYLPQLDFDRLDEIANKVDLDSMEDRLSNRVGNLLINKDDLNQMNNS